MKTAPLWWIGLATAMAGALGWGIRGQYGHETGAMIAGLLVGFTLALFFLRNADPLTAARVVALFALAISFGGSMTYGQTIGLTQDPELVGNRSALLWGLLGLFIKGGIWIGFAGVFLGLGLSGQWPKWSEMALLLWASIFLWFAGVWLFNSPFDPEHRLLPPIYFSDDWRWEPAGDLKPRRETWGGLLLSLVGVAVYLGWIRRNRLVWRMAAWGFLAGGLGFSLGQCIQASHAWHPEWYRQGWFASWEPLINWWNMMETAFGAIFGLVLAIGLWLNRHLITAEPRVEHDTADFSPGLETGLLLLHAVAVAVWNFVDFEAFDAFTDIPLAMAVIPIAGILGGRHWPFWFTLPIVGLPIAGKTVRSLVYETNQIGPVTGWLIYFVLPLVILAIAAHKMANQSKNPAATSQENFIRPALLLVVWIYFGLNFAFFQYPWPWNIWTARTPNALIFLVCAVGLTLAALMEPRKAGRRASF